MVQSEKRDDSQHQEILEEPVEEVSDSKHFATPDELEKGKLPPEEILSLPMFKVTELSGVAIWILHYLLIQQKEKRRKKDENQSSACWVNTI